ncbi:MAG: hypothetical protein OQJ99_05365 [Rhodospirillales bacterium]|nr:hypothetical protein [Rhodospirillales bacterium]MCW8862109.1 hypothetical protein [Rhodospirillales bacterium]MCW8952131.1 hypothetical protein [Rhodospirillales bacterium]MCW8971360.1 hypothetical protein [Rhodospirillales bacterium]MCW9001785.1 hypothetical protein [Rhodospirillales bacterium]
MAALITVLLVGLSTTEAQAFCIVNAASAPVYAQSLDATGLAVEIAPGARACPADPATGSTVSLLVVTDFRPVGQKGSRPGWRAECRAKAAARGWVEIRGTLKRITCLTHAKMPEGWQD